jgi:hypothetical protein
MLSQRMQFSGFRASAAAPRMLAVAVRASAAAAPATLPKKSIEGAALGEEQLSLKVATDTAKGLVHRYLVYVQQNARRVSAVGPRRPRRPRRLPSARRHPRRHNCDPWVGTPSRRRAPRPA